MKEEKKWISIFTWIKLNKKSKKESKLHSSDRTPYDLNKARK